MRSWILAAALALPAFAAQQDSREAQFLSTLHFDSQAEIQLGELLAQRADRPSVRRFGRKLADDYAALDARVLGLARRRGVELTEPAGEAAARSSLRGEERRELFAATGGGLDTLMLGQALQDEAVIRRNAGIEFRDQQLNQLATDLVPVLDRQGATEARLLGSAATSPSDSIGASN